MLAAYTGPGPGVGVVNGQPLPSTQYTRAAPALPGGGGVDVGNVGMEDSAVQSSANQGSSWQSSCLQKVADLESWQCTTFIVTIPSIIILRRVP